jgi:hypothetical protein
MAHVFLAEGFDGVLMANQHPGKGWDEAIPVDDRPTASLHDLATGLAREITRSRKLQAQSTTGAPEGLLSAPDDPQADFHRLAERTSKVLGISLADAYSRVASEAPTLYERATARARLN